MGCGTFWAIFFSKTHLASLITISTMLRSIPEPMPPLAFIVHQALFRTSDKFDATF
jgi:hypothetical protein